MKARVTVNGQDVSEFGADLRVPLRPTMQDLESGVAWTATMSGGWPVERKIEIRFTAENGEAVTWGFDAAVRRLDRTKIEIDPLTLNFDKVTISFPDEEAATAFLTGLG